jgi:hypothetical protein
MVAQTARSLLQTAYTRKLPIRLIGVRLTNFDEEEQMELSLFPSKKKKQDILTVVDTLRKKFGDDVIHVGGG